MTPLCTSLLTTCPPDILAAGQIILSSLSTSARSFRRASTLFGYRYNQFFRRYWRR